MRSLSLTVLLTASIAAAEPVDYSRDVKPVLKERCYACHGALKQESKLRLDTVAAIRRGGEGGEIMTPGDPDGTLMDRITSIDDSVRMPPEGKPLTEPQVRRIRAWLEQGATGPSDERPEENPRDHWAFQVPEKVKLAQPNSASKQAANPIDLILDAERARQKLGTVGKIEKRLLLRRLYLDLIGLPPTRNELHEFLDDASPDAYPRIVDRLLDSPHYGERWGRHWMDIWRYADWHGLGKQLRYSQKHIWHWRDWIVQSLNDDKGYDRMLVEMLAADEIAPTDHDALRATGFLARNYYLFNRTTWLDDTIEHTSKAMLGLTMNCTKCHDHKYDPLSQEDYYRLRAIFEPHQVRLDPITGEIDLEKDGLPRVFDAHPAAKTYLHIRGDAKNPDKSREIQPGPPSVLTFAAWSATQVDLPPEAQNPALQGFVLRDHLRAAGKAVDAARKRVERAKSVLAKTSAAPEPVVSTEDELPAFLRDDFTAARPKIWEEGPGSWRYENGCLTQKAVGAERRYIRTREDHPADFLAKMKFKILGGQKWKSVGICFDVIEDREKLVYLSAVSPGSKLQISYKTSAAQAYPPEAKQDRQVALDHLFELQIAVRGSLVNVSLDGQFAVAYRLPVAREAGKMDIIAFDAAAEFHEVLVQPLPTTFEMIDAGTAAAQPPPGTLEQAKADVAVAESALAVALLKPEVLRTAYDADVAKIEQSDRSAAFRRQAALAARQYELAQAHEALAIAERNHLNPTDKQKKTTAKALQTAREKVKKANEAIPNPGDQYPSLQVSLKALESPAETEASRRQAYPGISTGRRSAFARWVVDRQNPLTSRVAVNHIWMRHFGQPLVDPVDDFGRRTETPVQQRLLDWLAVDFVEHNWSIKHLHRMIVTSEAYQRDSSIVAADPKNIALDPTNQYYWRRMPMRMESQVVRDSVIHLAGVLDMTLGGPTIDPATGDNLYRRSIYFNHSGDQENKFLSMFDNADILRCYRRNESIVPAQALTLANSKLSLSMARKIAADLDQQQSDDDFIQAAFETILCLEPIRDEVAACRQALDETKTLLKDRGPAIARRRGLENLVHALLNHNEFITIR